jgi:hypothetical protein
MPDHVADDVWIGRVPTTRQVAALPARAIVDLCAELSGPRRVPAYRACPALDLVPVEAATLQRTADAIETLRRDGAVLVTCALGYGRSAAAIAAWLVRTGRAADTAAALAMLRDARPRVTLDTVALARALDAPVVTATVPLR